MPRQFPALPLLLLLSGCWSSRPTPTDSTAFGVALDTLPIAVIELPEDVRDGVPPPREIPVKAWTRNDDSTWRTDLPIRPRATFSAKAPPRGVSLIDADGRRLPYGRGTRGRGWKVEDGAMVLMGYEFPPELRMQAPLARAREARLHPKFSGIADPAAFAHARLQIGDGSHTGLLLPAPAHLAVDVEVPEAAELHLTPILVPPELRDGEPSDGATLRVDVELEGRITTIHRQRLAKEGLTSPQRIDVSRWSGQRIRLHLYTEPGTSSRADHVLIADPVLAPRRANPRRVVLAFIDTLRPDHLSSYGYGRPTSPWMDRVASDGLRFTRARSVAPWTLPSYRSVLTGHRPERWAASRTLGEQLRSAGFRTGLLGANLYLGESFEGGRGFGRHEVHHLAPADIQVDRALTWLKETGDRDALLMLHLMDPHLPYTEPEPHRTRFAQRAPSSWTHEDRFLRHDVRGTSSAERDWIIGRYDNNIAFVDAELARLDEALGPDDLLVVFSDHGEEFWDHGGFEHGHTLHEELIRVPLLVRGRGVPAQVIDTPVSLMDITPTVLDWAGLPAVDGIPGRSLLTLDGGDPRALPLGHPLYGFERWGVIADEVRHEHHAGSPSWAQLGDAPLEHPLDAPPAVDGDALLAQAHERAVVHPERVGISVTRALDEPLIIDLVGDPPDSAWLGEDASSAGLLQLEALPDATRIHIPATWRGTRDVYVLGPSPIRQLRIDRGQVARELRVDIPSVFPEGQRARLDLPLNQHVRLRVTSATVPAPDEGDTPVSGFNEELREMLMKAGYLKD